MPRGIAASSSSSSRTWKQTMSTEMPWEEQGGSEGGWGGEQGRAPAPSGAQGHSPSAPGGPAWPGGSPGSSARATLGAAALRGGGTTCPGERGAQAPTPGQESERGPEVPGQGVTAPTPLHTHPPSMGHRLPGNQCSQCQAGENPGVLGLPTPPQAPYPASASCSGWRKTAPAAAPRSSSASRKLCLPREKTPRGS